MKRDKRYIHYSSTPNGRNIRVHFRNSDYLGGAGAILSAGLKDHLSAHYYDRDHTLILSTRSSLGYIGAELIRRDCYEKVSEIFLDDYELRPDIFELSECKIADIIAEYLPYD